MRPLIILRPEPGAGRTGQRAAQMGLTTGLCPLFEGRALDWQAPSPDRFDALLITSAQTVRLAGPQLDLYRALPAYAVGQATAGAMAAGFSAVIAGETDGTAIAARIAADGHRSVFLPGGADTAQIEAGPLTLHRIAVYAMVETDAAGLDALVRKEAVLMVHSPRAGRRLAALVSQERRRRLHIVAISAAAQAACGGGWASVQAVERPEDERMLALARRLCE
ncbi:uroporphyrinogen-III synthase [Sphingobium faniae]|nr:uroporphyrinogen-III synthase [Sphingobium faniae]